MSNKTKNGFTLIELLIVIAIISLVATILLIGLNDQRAKARDVRRMEELRQIQNAIYMYYHDHNLMPVNRGGERSYCDWKSNFLKELTDEGLLPAKPKDPLAPSYQYCYYDYGAGNDVGVLLVTTLENAADSTTGISPSCRPWSAGENWCDQSNNKYYCLCLPY